MINKKLCVTAGEGRLMLRIDPKVYEEALKKAGCSPMIMKGKALKGYVNVREDNLQTDKDLQYWITLALDFNGKAKAAGRK